MSMPIMSLPFVTSQLHQTIKDFLKQIRKTLQSNNYRYKKRIETSNIFISKLFLKKTFKTHEKNLISKQRQHSFVKHCVVIVHLSSVTPKLVCSKVVNLQNISKAHEKLDIDFNLVY